MAPHRSSFQIALDILTVIGEGEKKPTRIMYAANLNWNSMSDTLGLLVDKGYIDENYISKRNKKYSITLKGREPLGYYNQIESLVQFTT